MTLAVRLLPSMPSVYQKDGRKTVFRSTNTVLGAADTVRFSAQNPVGLKGFRTEDLSTIRQMMKGYRYGKNLAAMLHPDSRMRVSWYKGRIVLRNFDFHPQLPGQPMVGVCHEVAADILQGLRQRLGERYCFELAYGHSERFFTKPGWFKPGGAHVYILGWTKENDAKVRPQLVDSKKPICLPSDALLIDPSFNLTGEQPQAQGYSFRRTLEPLARNFDPAREDYFQVLSPTDPEMPGWLPLGFLKDIDPGVLPKDKRANDLIHIGFVKELGYPPEVVLGYQKEGQSVEKWAPRQWEKELPAGSLLRQFVDKLESDLRNPDVANCAALDRRHPFRKLPFIQDDLRLPINN